MKLYADWSHEILLRIARIAQASQQLYFISQVWWTLSTVNMHCWGNILHLNNSNLKNIKIKNHYLLDMAAEHEQREWKTTKEKT